MLLAVEARQGLAVQGDVLQIGVALNVDDEVGGDHVAAQRTGDGDGGDAGADGLDPVALDLDDAGTVGLIGEGHALGQRGGLEGLDGALLLRDDVAVELFVAHADGELRVDILVLVVDQALFDTVLGVASLVGLDGQQHGILPHLAGDGDVLGQVGLGGVGADLDLISAGIDLVAVVGLVIEGQIGDLDLQLHGLGLTGLELDLLETFQALDRALERGRSVGLGDVELSGLLTGDGAGVLDVEGHFDRVVGVVGGLVELQVGILEGGIAQAEAEGIAGRVGAVVVHIGTAVLVAGGEQLIVVDAGDVGRAGVVDGLVPGVGGLAGGVDLAGDDAAEAGALADAAEAGPQDGVHVVLPGIHAHGAAGLHDNDAVGIQPAHVGDQGLLVVGQDGAGAVAVLLGVALGGAGDHDDGVGRGDGGAVGVGQGVAGDVGQLDIGVDPLDGLADAALDVHLIGGVGVAGGVQALVHVGLPGADDHHGVVAAGGGDLQGQHALVLQHDDGFLGHGVVHLQALHGLVGDGAAGGVLGALTGAGLLGVPEVGIELAGGDAGGHQTVHRDVQGVLGELALVGLGLGLDHAADLGAVGAEAAVAAGALQVLAVGHGAGQGLDVGHGGAGEGVLIAVALLRGDGVTVRGDVTAEAEGLAQQRVHQIGAVGAGLAVEGGVGGHQGGDVRLLNDVAVGRGVVLAQGAQAGGSAAVEAVALGVVGDVVLDGGDGLLVAVGVQQIAV